jgi:hypothetical protein
MLTGYTGSSDEYDDLRAPVHYTHTQHFDCEDNEEFMEGDEKLMLLVPVRERYTYVVSYPLLLLLHSQPAETKKNPSSIGEFTSCQQYPS